MSDARGRGVARKAKTSTGGWRQRFGVIIAFVLATLIGLPLANALLGEVAAMILAAFIGGFALGRMTLKRG
jgi:hypothetical protein